MGKTFKTHPWTDQYSWKMDLLKSFISFLGVTIVTILLFTFCLDRKKHKWEAMYGLKLETLREFERTSLIYTNVSFDVCSTAYSGVEKEQSSIIMQKWKDDVYDNLDLAETSMRDWFFSSHKQLESNLDNLDSHKEALKRLVDSIPNYRDSMSWSDFKTIHLKPIRDRYALTRRQILLECASLLD